MAFLVASKKTQIAIYDFASDPSGGAVGTVDLLVYVPPGSVITRCYNITYVAPTSGGAAVIGAVIANAAIAAPLVAPQAPGAYVLGQAAEGVDFNANPYLLPPLATLSIQMTIGVAPLTAGKIAFAVEYTEIAA